MKKSLELKKIKISKLNLFGGATAAQAAGAATQTEPFTTTLDTKKNGDCAEHTNGGDGVRTRAPKEDHAPGGIN